MLVSFLIMLSFNWQILATLATYLKMQSRVNTTL
jgi:hypothetical protein